VKKKIWRICAEVNPVRERIVAEPSEGERRVAPGSCVPRHGQFQAWVLAGVFADICDR
jgi:hypothetical protein